MERDWVNGAWKSEARRQVLACSSEFVDGRFPSYIIIYMFESTLKKKIDVYGMRYKKGCLFLIRFITASRDVVEAQLIVVFG